MTDGTPTAPPESPYRTPEAEGVAQGAKISGLAIAALVLAFIPCVNIVAVVLAVIALVKISNRPKVLKGSGLAIAAIVIGVLWNVIGVLAAIAIPNFMRFNARAKQSEAKSNLKSIFITAKANSVEQDQMGTTLEEIGWVSMGTTRYTYYFGDSRVEPDQSPTEPLPPMVESYARPDGTFQAVAVGNIDSDDTLDVWVITDENNLENVINDIVE